MFKGTLLLACIRFVRLRIIKDEWAFSIAEMALSSPCFSLFSLLYCLCTDSESAPSRRPNTCTYEGSGSAVEAATAGVGSGRNHSMPCRDHLKKNRKQPPAQVDGETCRKRGCVRPAASAVAGCGLATCGRMRGVYMGANVSPLSWP